MNRINFIQTPSKSQHRSTKIWYTCSILTLLTLGSVIAYKQIQLHKTLQKVYTEYIAITQHTIPFEQTERHKNELVCAQEELNKQQCSLTQMKHKQALTTNILQHITTYIVPTATLQSLTIHEQNLSMELIAPSSSIVLGCVEQLQKNSFLSYVQLIALLPQEQKVCATITATIS